jgi:peptide/nickel transport system permease protein
MTAVTRQGATASAIGGRRSSQALQRLLRQPSFIVGAVITLVFVLVAIAAPVLAPHDPSAPLLLDQIRAQSNPVPGPQDGFPLGADPSGRDLLSRLIGGATQTLIVGVMATLGGFIGGILLGLLAGVFGGRVDTIVMRVVDIMLAIPSLLMAFSIAALFVHPNQWTLILAIAIVQIPIFARLMRGSMLAQRETDHVLAARSLGVRSGVIVFRHMVPNALGPVIVQATLSLAISILDAAALSFLGLGNPDDALPEWGQMLGGAQQYFNSFPHLAVYPALCIIVVALGFTLMGESLRETLDPRSRR